MPLLGVNIDHVATLRQARREFEPDPVLAAWICEQAGADSIVAHLREDRRHINESDIRRLKRSVRTRFNLEMSLNPEILEIACRIKPDQATFVPEKRQEITTEGGLDVVRHFSRIQKAVRQLHQKNIEVSLFIHADKRMIDKTHQAGVNIIELHTGSYDQAKSKSSRLRELRKLTDMTHYARQLGLTVNAGHGLKYNNTAAVARIRGMHELNIGHSIVSRAVLIGLDKAVREMARIAHGEGKSS